MWIAICNVPIGFVYFCPYFLQQYHPKFVIYRLTKDRPFTHRINWYQIVHDNLLGLTCNVNHKFIDSVIVFCYWFQIFLSENLKNTVFIWCKGRYRSQEVTISYISLLDICRFNIVSDKFTIFIQFGYSFPKDGFVPELWKLSQSILWDTFLRWWELFIDKGFIVLLTLF